MKNKGSFYTFFKENFVSKSKQRSLKFSLNAQSFNEIFKNWNWDFLILSSFWPLSLNILLQNVYWSEFYCKKLREMDWNDNILNFLENLMHQFTLDCTSFNFEGLPQFSNVISHFELISRPWN